MPDVLNTHAEISPFLDNMGVLLHLDEYITEEVRDSYFSNILISGSIREEKMHSFPWYQTNSITLFNSELMEQAGLGEEDLPETWDEVFELAPAFKEKTGKYLFILPFGDKTVIRTLFAREGISMIDEEGNPAFHTEEAVSFLNKIVALYQDGALPAQTLVYEHRREVELFQGRELGMYMGGPQFVRIIRQNAPRLVPHLIIRPAILGRGEKVHATVSQISVSQFTRYPELAVDFAGYITNADNQLEFARRVAILPTSREAARAPFFSEDPSELDDVEDIARVVAASQLPKMDILTFPSEHVDEINEIMLRAIQRACRGEVSADKALSDAVEEWKVLHGTK